GGWLMLFFVFICIGLGFSLLNLLITFVTGTFSLLNFAITFVFSLLPSIMMVFYILQRDIKFKYWYYFYAIVSIIGSLLGVVGSVVMLGTFAGNPGMMNDLMVLSGYGEMPPVSPALMNGVFIGIIIGMVIGLGITIAWWVYFNKSRRVAYTFDPRNNPPK
ncbi:TMEM43 family protein, partial [Ruminococcaceae bacterium OttesenSCG-928-I18]|nr:TMEM43 family protein [Ruminococcaceae bacterium OttesenSCG-928-I18]